MDRDCEFCQSLPIGTDKSHITSINMYMWKHMPEWQPALVRSITEGQNSPAWSVHVLNDQLGIVYMASHCFKIDR